VRAPDRSVDAVLLIRRALGRVIDGVLCYPLKVLNTIYQLFAIRANNFREIYGHRVSKAIEFMIMVGFERCRAHGHLMYV
jgi:HD superfamily phosphohydrolase